MITNGASDYPEQIIGGLERTGIRLDAVVQCAPEAVNWRDHFRRDRRQRGIVRAGLSFVKWRVIRRERIGDTMSAAKLPTASVRLREHPTDFIEGVAFNSPNLVALLRRLATDVLVLGGVGIVKPPTLSVPRIATLNVHPGLLPFFRGVGVVGRAVLHDFPVGVTCHLVNAGIDTGAIVSRRLVPADETDVSLDALQRRAMATCAAEMTDRIERLSRGEALVPREQMQRFPMSGWLNDAEVREVEARLRRGSAVRQFIAWRNRDLSHLSGPATWPAVGPARPQPVVNATCSNVP
jgi:folate-dependent phosphoribosylglycinamide formyltransferase PurN